MKTSKPFVNSQAFQEMAWTAYTFHEPLSIRMQIKDWWTARELDVAAAGYVQRELMRREFDREVRDRNFWIQAFGGDPSGGESGGEPDVPIRQIEVASDDEAIARSALRR